MNPFHRVFFRLPLRLVVLGVLLVAVAAAGTAQAQQRDSFRIAWSIYVGWMPWGFGADSGIVAKWADKYGIDIEVVQINDYIESINLYTAGAFDGVTVTNMDALTIPAAGGVDTTALIVGDFSDGNDGLILKGTDRLEDVRGRNVNLVELSVSHYLLARALEAAGMTERDVRVVNTSDADIVAAFASRDVEAVVTWNPQLGEIRAREDAHVVFDSSQIPGEIMDLLLVNTAVLEANPEAREGAGRCLVRNHGRDARRRRGRPRGARRDGRGRRHRPDRLRGAARVNPHVLRRGGRGGLRHRTGAERDDGESPPVRVRARPAR
jgi:NitT/TauT family transport system substrate-binding protein